jgi:putative NIF3 family GTP cyclohydrolase 1 type 2
MQVKDIIHAIKTAAPSPEISEVKTPFSDKPMQIHTCDVLHFGDPENEVHKIGTTFMVTVDIIQRAIAEGIDMIITHEPSTCGGLDRSIPVKLNKVTAAKLDLINKSGINIWRFHDGMHHQRPDLIYAGWMKELGWENYNIPGPNNHEFKIPETDVRSIAELLKERLHINTPRVIGNPDLKISKVGVLVGGGGQGLGNMDMPMEFLLDKDLDLMIYGDIHDLISCAFWKDALALGLQKAAIVIGHHKSEECGMKYLAEWLAPLVPGIPVTFLEAEDPIHCI